MTEKRGCTFCGADGHLAAQCDWGKSEREQFETWVLRERPGSPLRYVRDALPVDDPRYGEYCDDTLQCAWEGWRARAALAQPSGEVVVTKNESGAIVSVTRQDKEGRLLSVIAESQPSPAQAEQAEAERPEVVGVRYEDGTILSAEDCGTALEVCAKVQTPLMTVAQHERIVKAWIERWKAYIELSAKIAAQRDAAQARVAELERGTVYVEARRCSACGHGGVNDGADGLSACGHCEWTGPQPSKDECPDCLRKNCMSVACPECAGRYELVAEAKVAAPVAQAGQVPEGVRAWFEAKMAHVNAVDAYNARLKFVREHCPFGTSVDPEYQLMEDADRKARSLVGPMFDELRALLAAAPAQGGSTDE